MPNDATSKPLTNNVTRFVTVADVRLKIVEALGADAIDIDYARLADVKTTGASAAELRAIFERLDALVAGKLP